MKSKARLQTAAVALAVVGLVVGVAQPAMAATSVSKACRNSAGVSTGTMNGALTTGSVRTEEQFGECGTVKVRGTYIAYVGGPSYLSSWVSNSTYAYFSHSNMYHGDHTKTYAPTDVYNTWF